MVDLQKDLENTFGRIVIAEGYASAIQVEESLKSVRKLAELGIREKLGAVMVKKGYLTPDQVDAVLEIQGKRQSNRIEGFEIVSKLGQGAMGSVFKARQLSLDRIVAVKVLSGALSKNKSYVERFLSEARSVAKLNHRNIIQGIDVGESNGHYYFAMEFVDGMTVAEALREHGPLEEKRALKIVEDIALALEHAHAHHLVHRDVKPDNIMITRSGECKLCDLGLAKSIEEDAGQTAVGHVVGTPHYISPEQARGRIDLDIRADIYSLGASLYHMLTGHTPFTGGNPTIVMTKHITEEPEDPRRYVKDISQGTLDLIKRMMAKDVARRYPDPAALLADIRRVQRGQRPLVSGKRSSVKTPARQGSSSGSEIRVAPLPERVKPQDEGDIIHVRRRQGTGYQPTSPGLNPFLTLALVVGLAIGAAVVTGEIRRMYGSANAAPPRGASAPGDIRQLALEVAALISAGGMDEAAAAVRSARTMSAFRESRDVLDHLDFDVGRLAWHQERAFREVVTARPSGVTVHHQGEPVTGEVAGYEGDTLVLATRLGKLRIGKSCFLPADIRRYAVIDHAAPQGAYDYALLLLHEGKREEAKAYFEKCLGAGGDVASRAKRHLDSLR